MVLLRRFVFVFVHLIYPDRQMKLLYCFRLIKFHHVASCSAPPSCIRSFFIHLMLWWWGETCWLVCILLNGIETHSMQHLESQSLWVIVYWVTVNLCPLFFYVFMFYSVFFISYQYMTQFLVLALYWGHTVTSKMIGSWHAMSSSVQVMVILIK